MTRGGVDRPGVGRSARWVTVAVVVAAGALLLGVGLLGFGLLGPGRGGTWRSGIEAGSAVAAERVDTLGPALSVRHLETGRPAEDATAVADDKVVAAVLSDLNSFWAATLPSALGRKFVPLTGGYVSVDSAGPPTPAVPLRALCVTKPAQIAGNAYYCPDGDGIVYDSAALVPVLLGHYGVGGLATAFAHEFGHAIQAQVGPSTAQRDATDTQYPSIVIEAQGDCYAGAFLAWVTSGAAPHLHLPSSSLARAIAPLLDFRDPVSVGRDDPTAHGLAVDRASSVLTGLRSGARGCHAITRSTLTSTLGRPGVAPLRSARFPTSEALLAAARTSVDSYAAGWLPTGSGPAGSGQPGSAPPGSAPAGSAPAGSAPADAPVPSDLAVAARYGQFATAAGVALAVGRRLTGSPAGAACFTGGWTAAVFGHAPAGALGSASSDADEALDLISHRPDAGFDELSGFIDGFHGGKSACQRR